MISNDFELTDIQYCSDANIEERILVLPNKIEYNLHSYEVFESCDSMSHRVPFALQRRDSATNKN